MFNSPGWAALIDVKIAAGVAGAVSRSRLLAYGLQNQEEATCDRGNEGAEDVVGAVARHGVNMVLCEAFYPVLHMVEIVLRSRIHDAFSMHFNSAFWYEGGRLGEGHQRMVDAAKTELLQRGIERHADRVIAELSFGFWCGMFHARYEHRAGPWPALLRSVFPRVPKSWATREKIRIRLEAARLIRNRGFHHHPISQYQDLHARHRALVELLGWMSPDARAHVGAICRFNAVHADRLRLATPDSPCISELPTVI